MSHRRCSLLTALAGLLASSAMAAVRIVNPSGNTTIRVERREKVDIRHTARGRESLPSDIRIGGAGGDLNVRAEASDGATVDIEVALPYGIYLEASTTTGSISFTGVAFRARFDAGDGNIRVTAPWTITRLLATFREEPGDFTHPRGLRGRQNAVEGHWGWVLDYRGRSTCCDIRISGRRPCHVELLDMPPPQDSPVKPHQQAKSVLEAISDGVLMRKARAPSFSGSPERSAPVRERDGTPTFVSDVRLVSLFLAAYDSDGHPAAGLRPDDFEVLENGVPQNLAAAASGEAEFNLALLLDFSGTTAGARTFVEGAAREFTAVGKPQDRLALYALAWNFFYVGSWLSREHRQVEDLNVSWEGISGGTPLYDSIVLACAEELLQRPDERNALIIVSDGLDNQFSPGAAPSSVSFEALRRAAQEMPVLLYPICLSASPGSTARTRATARENLQALADASGGRLFTVKSIGDLAPVAAQVAEELRSVYTLAYYPKNQNFDGKWRKIEVRVKRPDVKFRTRPGYYAR